MQSWYVRYERIVSSISLITGFIWNALFLKRVDLFLENFWVVVHLLLISAAILIINWLETKRMASGGQRSALHFWVVTILQFVYGGLLSTYLVFYFRSATLSVTWPFILILAAAFIANERLKKHYDRLIFQIGLLYLALFSFTIFFVPVLINEIGKIAFLISGVASLVLIGLFLLALRAVARPRFNESKHTLILCIACSFFVINGLYFLNLIPPIPLSIKDAGIYHSISKNPQGQYIVSGEAKNWYDVFSFADTIHLTDTEPAYAYSAIFSPADFQTDIVHQWQEYNPTTRKWVTRSTVMLAAIGGRDNGYRTYSFKSTLEAGKWRVNIKTTEGQVIGRLRFDVVSVPEPTPIVVENKQ